MNTRERARQGRPSEGQVLCFFCITGVSACRSYWTSARGGAAASWTATVEDATLKLAKSASTTPAVDGMALALKVYK